MREADNTDDASATQTDSAKDGVGDLETAGETTAAGMIGGPPDIRPVGVETIANIKVSDMRNPSESDND